jgi:hypothetical protein
MLRASILLFIFTIAFQALLHWLTGWFGYFSVLLCLFVAFLFILLTNFIWQLEWDDILEIFSRESEDDGSKWPE